MQQQNTIAAMLAGMARSGGSHFSLLRQSCGQICVRGSKAQHTVLTIAMVGSIVLLSLAARIGQATDQMSSLTNEQVSNSIRTAIEATPGRVLKAEVQNQQGTTYCSVRIYGDDGKTHDIAVNVSSNQVATPEYVSRNARLHTSKPNMAEMAIFAWPMK